MHQFRAIQRISYKKIGDVLRFFSNSFKITPKNDYHLLKMTEKNCPILYFDNCAQRQKCGKEK